MITIEYSEEGKAFSDFALKDLIRLIKLSGSNLRIKLSNATPILAVLIACLNKELDINNVQFIYGEVILYPVSQQDIEALLEVCETQHSLEKEVKRLMKLENLKLKPES